MKQKNILIHQRNGRYKTNQTEDFMWDSHQRYALTKAAKRIAIAGSWSTQVWRVSLSMAIAGTQMGDTCHIRGQCKSYVREYPHKILCYIVQYLQFRYLEWPLSLVCNLASTLPCEYQPWPRQRLVQVHPRFSQ